MQRMIQSVASHETTILKAMHRAAGKGSRYSSPMDRRTMLKINILEHLRVKSLLFDFHYFV